MLKIFMRPSRVAPKTRSGFNKEDSRTQINELLAILLPNSKVNPYIIS
jgi:hypothetical protein